MRTLQFYLNGRDLVETRVCTIPEARKAAKAILDRGERGVYYVDVLDEGVCRVRVSR